MFVFDSGYVFVFSCGIMYVMYYVYGRLFVVIYGFLDLWVYNTWEKRNGLKQGFICLVRYFCIVGVSLLVLLAGF